MGDVLDFDAAVREAQGEPVRFRLGGQDFACLNPIPAHAALKMVSALNEDLISPSSVWRNYIADCLPDDEDRARLDGAIQSSGIGTQTLVECMKKLVEAATGRPTEPQADSADLRSTDGEASKPAAPSKASSLSPSGAANS